MDNNLIIINETKAYTSKTTSQLLRMINRTTLPIGVFIRNKNEYYNRQNSPVNVVVDNDRIEIVPPVFHLTKDQAEGLMYLLCCIIDRGYISLTATDSNNESTTYRIKSNNFYQIYAYQSYKIIDNASKERIKKQLIRLQDQELFAINLDKKIYFQINRSPNYTSLLSLPSKIISYLLYNEWNKNRIIILGRLYNLKKLWEETRCEKILSDSYELNINSITPTDDIDIKWYKDKLYVNYDKDQKIDLYSIITTQLLKTKDSIISPIVTSLILTDEVKGWWNGCHVGIISNK